MSGDISHEELLRLGADLLRQQAREAASLRVRVSQDGTILLPADAKLALFDSEEERLEAEALSADLDRRLAEALAKSEELLRSLDRRLGT
jgi:hypothetical protein